ncbi:MAG: 16S rRNA (cytosine(967)-C(5))-methyltransferase RsmB [Clostridia bacterium]|nr:16S rRNA (cytosine(967)-C(5))-methyltransferase RsmB [Clostridia bacterium]
MNKEIILCYDILSKVYFEKAYASIELNKVLNASVNKALVTKVVYGVLEQDIYLDFCVHSCVKKEPKPQILLLLKMATYMSKNISGIPLYALTNECVELAKKYADKYVAGFVNATIKNLSKTEFKLPNKSVDYAKYLSVKYSYPKWYVDYLLSVHDKGFVESLLAFKPTTDTHIRVIKQPNCDINTSTDEFVKNLEKFGIRYQKSALYFTMYVDYNKLLEYTELKDYYVVQGLPSIITALSVGAEHNDKVLDCTSAPGGKACLIAGLDNTIRVTACDLHIHRVALIKKYASSLKLNNVIPLVADATKFDEKWQDTFDRVLCDVPCSGMGVVTKKPDILLNRSMSDVNELVGLQYQILCNNSKYVKHGGTLVYSTCSIIDKENEGIIQKFLKSHSDFKLVSIDTHKINVSNNGNMYTFYPHLTQTEGFFIAKLERL